MNKQIVFISSVMAGDVEDLLGERRVAIETVNSFPVFEAWAFEKSPASAKDPQSAYLEQVRAAGLFVLIVGGRMTQPVLDEYNTAVAHGKPILAFLKEVRERETSVERLLTDLRRRTKYASFCDVEDLSDVLRRTLEAHISAALTGERHEPPSVLRSLRNLGNRQVQINRFFPTNRAAPFFILREVSSEVVHLQNCGNPVNVVYIPTNRIEDVIPEPMHEPATLGVRGRLQWLTPSREWKYFREEPPENDLLRLGCWKACVPSDRRVQILTDLFSTWGFKVSFWREDRVPNQLTDSWEVIYDEDGFYFRWLGPDCAQILMMKHPSGYPAR